MRTVRISDCTIENAAVMGKKLSFKERLDAVKLLDDFKADVIRLGAIGDDKEYGVFVKTVAATVRNSALSCTVDFDVAEVDTALAALKDATKKILLVSLPSSPALMEYKLGKKPQAALKMLSDILGYIKEKGAEAEVRLVDATNAEKSFILEAIKVASSFGVKEIAVCDEAGALLPDEFAAFVSEIKKDAKEYGVRINVAVRNPFNLSLAISTAAIFAGADGVELCYGSSEVTPFGETVSILSSIGLKKGVKINAVTTMVSRVVKELGVIFGEKGEVKPLNVGLMEEKILPAGTTEKELMQIVSKLGYVIEADDFSKVYEAFSRIMAKKGKVNVRELDVIIATSAMQVPAEYKIVDYIINTGNIIKTTASVTLEKGGAKLFGLSTGDGPIDAAFLAIESITGTHYELDEFKIESVTEGKDAMGEAVVKLRHEGSVYVGAGISTDIVGASIRAYVNALNKIVYGEKR